MARLPLIAVCAAALLLLLCRAAASEEVYRWVDEDGVVHYSDQPHPGAEEIELESAPTISMPAARSRPARRADEPESEARDDAVYETLTFAHPPAEETLWNLGGVLDVRLNLQPALRADHQVRVYFDGTPQMVSGTQFQLEEVWRGEHNLQAEVLDGNGNLLIRSEPIRFYVQQTSIRNPQRR